MLNVDNIADLDAVELINYFEDRGWTSERLVAACLFITKSEGMVDTILRDLFKDVLPEDAQEH